MKGLLRPAHFCHRHFEENGKLFLNAELAAFASEIQAASDLDRERRGEDRIFTKEINL